MDPINVLNGQIQTYRPGTYVTWRAEDVESQGGLSADKAVAVIGEAEGGVPLGAYVLTSPLQARSVLRGGDLLEAALLIFQAAGNVGATVVAVNVLGGTPATLEIPGATAATVFGTLTTANYRERANQMRAQVYGTPAAGFTVAISDGDSNYALNANRVGLGLNLQYRGTGSAATATVSVIGGVKTLTTEVTGAPQDNLRIPLTENTNVTALCRVIAQSGPYGATQGRDGLLLASDLDLTAAPVDIAATAALSAIKADFALLFATLGGGEVTFAPGADDKPGANFTGYFTGGTTTPTVNASWASAMDVLAKVPLSLIVPLTRDQIVVAGIRAALSERNSAAQGRFTMLVSGYDDARLPASGALGAVSAYVNLVAGELASINDHQSQLLVTTGTLTLPGSGKRARLPLYLAAALYAGEVIGNGVTESMTYSYVGLSDAFPPLNLAQTDALVRNGGLCLETPTAGGVPRVVRDRTTYTGSNNPVYESGLSVRVMNSVARGFKAIQDRYIPGSASSKRLADFQTAATDYFEARYEAGDLIGDGVDANGRSVPPYDFALLPTRAGGRHVVSRSTVVPKSEFTNGEHDMVARSVEFQVQSVR